jgi:hypothetical protein
MASYQIFGPGETEATIQGDDVASIDVGDGSLIILDPKGAVLCIFAPDQWVSVNAKPFVPRSSSRLSG